MAATHRVLLISGSLRVGSTNTALLQTARAVAPEGVATDLYDGLDRLPYFNPDDDGESVHPAVAELRARIGAADAVLFSTPEYAGGLPGSFKNLLDWTVGGGELYGKPVAWINASTSTTGAADAHASLRVVLRYTGAEIVEAACSHIPVRRDALDSGGLIADPALRQRVTDALAALARYAQKTENPVSGS